MNFVQISADYNQYFKDKKNAQKTIFLQDDIK